jgi:hypothetical protein
MADTADEMERVRAHIDRLIQAMLKRAERDRRFTSENLIAAHREITGTAPDVPMTPSVVTTYDWLFGFEHNARHYLDRRDDPIAPRTSKLNPITVKRLNRIASAITCKTLRICSSVPAFGKTPSTWWAFLSYAEEAITRDPDQTQPRDRLPSLGVARAFQDKVADFLSHYLVSETGPIPFGGRERELYRLNAWLRDENAAPRMLITGPSGRGKSALLIQWLTSVHRDPELSAGWQFAFMPISIRSGTNLPEVFFEGLARRLAEITNSTVPGQVVQGTTSFRDIARNQLSQIANSEQRVVVVIDGLDELPFGDLDPPFIPAALPPSLRFVCSARTQVGDADSSGWLRRLGWDGNVRVEEPLELDCLDRANVTDIRYRKRGVHN